MTGKLEIKNVSVVYPGEGGGEVQALKDINFNFQDNDFVVALGASGCGKTTLLNLLAGFIRPSKGEVLLTHNRAGAKPQPIFGPGMDRGVVFQKHALFPWLNVVDNVSFPLKIRKMERKKRREIAHRNLKLVKLEDFLDHQVYQLSGGMQQRVGIARALTSDPEILLMDEPLGALDALTREKTQEIILDVWKKTRKMVFFITHSVEEALFMATKLIVMSPRPGRISHVFELDFSSLFFKTRDARQVKSEPKFIEMREKILNIIYDQELS